MNSDSIFSIMPLLIRRILKSYYLWIIIFFNIVLILDLNLQFSLEEIVNSNYNIKLQLIYFNASIFMSCLIALFLFFIRRTTPPCYSIPTYSLCNVAYKILSKVVVRRVGPILHNIIHAMRGAFIPGKKAADNIIVAEELMQNIKTLKSKKGAPWRLKLA